MRGNLVEFRFYSQQSSRRLIFCLHLLRQSTKAGVVVTQEPREGLAPFPGNDPFPSHAPFKIPTGLPVGKFLGPEFRAVSTNMASVTATGELLVRSAAITGPTIVAGQLGLSLLPSRHRHFPDSTLAGDLAIGHLCLLS